MYVKNRSCERPKARSEPPGTPPYRSPDVAPDCTFNLGWFDYSEFNYSERAWRVVGHGLCSPLVSSWLLVPSVTCRRSLRGKYMRVLVETLPAYYDMYPLIPRRIESGTQSPECCSECLKKGSPETWQKLSGPSVWPRAVGFSGFYAANNWNTCLWLFCGSSWVEVSFPPVSFLLHVLLATWYVWAGQCPWGQATWFFVLYFSPYPETFRVPKPVLVLILSNLSPKMEFQLWNNNTPVL